MITRLTQDVDLFTNQQSGVRAAVDAVEDALREAGFRAERQDKTAGLSDIFYGMGEGLAEWVVTDSADRRVSLQMAYFDRVRDPVIMEFGPVLDLEDVLGGKVCALASRAYRRDFLDTAAALARYTPGYSVAHRSYSSSHSLSPRHTSGASSARCAAASSLSTRSCKIAANRCSRVGKRR
jgi:hypothetical protein